jgi:hypothetical protein
MPARLTCLLIVGSNPTRCTSDGSSEVEHPVRSLMSSAHTTTNADVIGRFLDLPIRITREQGDVYLIAVGSAIEDRTR